MLCVCQASRIDVLCCIKMSVKQVMQTDKIQSVLHWIVKHIYAPFLLNKYVRPIVVSSVMFKTFSAIVVDVIYSWFTGDSDHGCIVVME